jgi:hypothetical protein
MKNVKNDKLFVCKQNLFNLGKVVEVKSLVPEPRPLLKLKHLKHEKFRKLRQNLG